MAEMRSCKLLWVEDDHTTINGVVFPLRKKGWRITACSDFESAKKIVDSKEHFDFFLIDLILPQTSEYEDMICSRANDDNYLGTSLIEHIRKKRGESVPIGVFSVVYNPIVDHSLNSLNVNVRFTKGTASNAEICSTIENCVLDLTK